MDPFIAISVVVAIATFAYFAGMATSITDEQPKGRVRIRVTFCAGLVVTIAMLFLGGIWPSYFTLVAIAVLPAPFIFGIAIFVPVWLARSPKLRVYLSVCVVASAACWLMQFNWVTR